MEADPGELRRLAHEVRRTVVRMATGQGEGYIGQGLDVADILTVLIGHQMRNPVADRGPDADRLIFSAGHYSIGLWATLHILGQLGDHDIDSYARDGSVLIPSTLEGAPDFVELTGGSLAHGLGVAVGLAIGQRLRGSSGRTLVFTTDGEAQEGSTWEAAMLAGDHRLSNLLAVIDVNSTQADGDLVLDLEPLQAKWEAFGWAVQDVDGNDVAALAAGFDSLAGQDRPGMLIARTTLGCGVPLIADRERNHFVRVTEAEWHEVARQLELSR